MARSLSLHSHFATILNSTMLFKFSALAIVMAVSAAHPKTVSILRFVLQAGVKEGKVFSQLLNILVQFTASIKKIKTLTMQLSKIIGMYARNE